MTKKEFVSMSLPYGLKVLIPESDKKGCRKTVIGTVGAVFYNGSINCFDTVNACPKWYKPILRPLERSRAHKIERIGIYYTQYLIRNHYDIVGLIDKKQAIDVSTLKVNPYKKK